MSKRLFIVGSGFTRAVFGSSAPLNSEVLRALATIDYEFWAHLTRRYADEETGEIGDIEILLTRLDLDIARTQAECRFHNLHSELLEQRLQAERSLVQFFRNFRYARLNKDGNPWYTEFVDRVFQRGDTVVSLNYDCLLEGLLDSGRKWTPNGGYGPYLDSGFKQNWRKSQIVVLKIHGSENFPKDPIDGTMRAQILHVTAHEGIFSISGKSSHFSVRGSDEPHAIIAPSFAKVFPWQLHETLMAALKRTRRARTLVIVGCGLRREDSFLYQLLWQFLRGKGKRRVIVVDPDARRTVSRISDSFEFDLDQMRPFKCIETGLESGWQELADELAVNDDGSID